MKKKSFVSNYNFQSSFIQLWINQSLSLIIRLGLGCLPHMLDFSLYKIAIFCYLTSFIVTCIQHFGFSALSATVFLNLKCFLLDKPFFLYGWCTGIILSKKIWNWTAFYSFILVPYSFPLVLIAFQWLASKTKIFSNIELQTNETFTLHSIFFIPWTMKFEK